MKALCLAICALALVVIQPVQSTLVMYHVENRTLVSSCCPIAMYVTFEYYVTNTAIFPNGSFTGEYVDEARMRATVYGSNTTTAATTPMLVMEKTILSISPVKVEVEVNLFYNMNTSALAYDISLDDYAPVFLPADLTDNFQPPISTPGFNQIDPDHFNWLLTSMPVNESRTMRYTSTIVEGQFQEGLHDFTTSLDFQTSDASVNMVTDKSESFFDIMTSVCVDSVIDYKDSLFYQHGFTVLMFFIGLLVGVLLVILIVILLIRFVRRGPFAIVTPSEDLDKQRIRSKSSKLIVDPRQASMKGNAIQDFSLVAVDDSIVMILSMKENQKYREIDSLDILSTITVDTQIEKERNDAAIQATMLLITGLRRNNDISKSVEDSSISNFNRNMKDMERKFDDAYRKQLEEIYRIIGAKNVDRQTELLKKQKHERIDLSATTSGLSDKEQKDLMNLLEQQHQAEHDELTYMLKLEQDEETEKLRKEFAMCKRMAIKELLNTLLTDVQGNGKLSIQQADWLMKEHAKTQAALEKMYDDEISRQRMVLEEKLERRRAMAQQSDTQEDDHSELLNTIAGQQVQTITRLKKQTVLTPEAAAEYIEQVKLEMIAIKEKMDKEKQRQEAELHKKLSVLKKQKMAEKAKEHQADINTFEKRNQEQQTSGGIDPVSYSENKLEMLSRHRLDMSDIENQIDTEHAEELHNLRAKLSNQAQNELKDMEQKNMDKLQDSGMTEQQMRKLLQQHDREVAEIKESQATERQRQLDQLKEKLAKNKREGSKRQQEEKLEQEQLREYDNKVVSTLINSQASMSDEERKRILEEHERQMVKLENSLTLSKLKQKRMLEERLAAKRARKLETLQQKQQKEMANQQRRGKDDYDVDDYEGERTSKQQLNLMKKHAEQKLDMFQGQKLNWEKELEEVQIEMVKERAIDLRSQEEHLGAMLATLNLEKAKEMAKIEEQQKAINSLKSNLMDDLNERGVISNSECKRIIDIHKQENEKLNDLLENQRSKQEQAMRKKLNERIMQKEKGLLRKQEMELSQDTAAQPNKSAAKIRRMMMMHKQMVALEHFRNQSEREITQLLEDMRQKHEVEKMRLLQEQELKFVGHLVERGHLQKQELVGVLRMLYPRKNDQEISEVFAQICHGLNLPPETQDKDHLSANMNSTFTARVRGSIKRNKPSSRPGSSLAGSIKKSSLKKRGSGYKSVKYAMDEDSFDQPSSVTATRFSRFEHRPEPLGQDSDKNNMDYEDSQNYGDKPVGGRLPPVETPTVRKKKKKGMLKKRASQKVTHDEDDGYEY